MAQVNRSRFTSECSVSSDQANTSIAPILESAVTPESIPEDEDDESVFKFGFEIFDSCNLEI